MLCPPWDMNLNITKVHVLLDFDGRSCGKDYKLSVYIPPDPLINPGIPKCVETAIFCDDDMVHNDEWGYFDVLRFSGSRASGSDVVSQIIEERDRVKSLI